MRTEELVQEVESALGSRRTWEDKRRLHYSKRLGIRAEKTFPWKGCSNLRIPLTDKILRRIAPALKNSVFSVSPIVSVQPFGDMLETTARNVEHGYDWLLRYRMKRSREELGYAHDNCIAYGFGIVKNCWRYEAEMETRKLELDFVDPEVPRDAYPEQMIVMELTTRLSLDPAEHEDQIRDAVKQFRAGADPIEVTLETVVSDAPQWHFVDSMDCIVPWDSTTDIDRLPWIAHRMYKTRRELQVAKKHEAFDPTNTDKVIAAIGKDAKRTAGDLDIRRDFREGIGGEAKKSTAAQIWEIYYLADKDGDGVDEKHVLTWAADQKLLLRDIPYEYEHGEWPFTRFSFEENEPRWYSARGVVEMLLDLQVEADANHNSKLDNMAIRNTVSIIYRAGSIKDTKWRFSPGAMFPTQRGPQDAQAMSFQPMDFSANAEEESLRAWAEEYIGTPDFGISNINQRVERRTAAEVDTIRNSAGAIASEFLERTQESHRRLHRQTMLLWSQYGDPTVMVRVTGKPNPVPFTVYDLKQDYGLTPTGRLDNLTPQQRLQRDGVMIDLARDPTTGIYINTPEVVKDVIENLDYHNAARFLKEPGSFESDAKAKQTFEIMQMAILQEVAPVDEREPHAEHAEVCAQALQNGANQDDVPLISAHLAIHMFFLGNKAPLMALVKEGWQPIQGGQKITLAPPVQQQQPQEQEAIPA